VRAEPHYAGRPQMRRPKESAASPDANCPWPTPHAAWQDPPWLLTGRSVTAWFWTPWQIAQKVLPTELLPPRSPAVRSRLRFYDLEFTSLSGSSTAFAPTSGRFYEATIGFAAQAGSLAGDVSQLMWTDSDTYMSWGREAFGWPLTRGAFEFAGSLWDRTGPEGTSGSCRLLDRLGSLTLVIERVNERITTQMPQIVWFIPRRRLRWTRIAHEARELLVVRPKFQRMPVRYSANGRASIDFDAPHVLHGVSVANAEIEILDGIQLEVGGDVEEVPLND
jgi:hypothetical protein